MSENAVDERIHRAGSLAGDLADAGLLSEQQANAYALRDVYGVGRQHTADAMGVTVSTVDKHLRAARDKVDSARSTLDELRSVEDAPTPALAEMDTATDSEGNQAWVSIYDHEAEGWVSRHAYDDRDEARDAADRLAEDMGTQPGRFEVVDERPL